MSTLRLIAGCILTATCLRGVAAGQEPPKPASRPIAELLQQLGAANYREREAAQRALGSRDEAFAEIHRALPKLNAEGRKRASAILDAMAHRRVKRIVQYARDGRIDLLIEWAAVARKSIDAEAFWQCMLDAGWDVLTRTKSKDEVREFEKYFPGRNYARLQKDRPGWIREVQVIDGPLPMNLFVSNSDGVSGHHLTSSLVVSAGAIKLTGVSHFNIIITNSDVVVDYPSNTVIISDGNVQLKVVDKMAVAARGTVSFSVNLQNPYSNPEPLLRGHVPQSMDPRDPFDWPEEYDLLDRHGEPPRRIYVPDARKDGLELARAERLRPAAELVAPDVHTEPPAHGIRFFELSDVGLSASAAAPGVAIASLRRDSPLAKAGLQARDVILAVDGNACTSEDTLRRQFRRAFVLGGAELTVQREGKLVVLAVSFYGWELPGKKSAAAK